MSSKLLSRFTNQNIDVTYYIARWNPTRLSVDTWMRIVGSGLVIIAYFIVLHVNVMVGVVTHFIA